MKKLSILTFLVLLVAICMVSMATTPASTQVAVSYSGTAVGEVPAFYASAPRAVQEDASQNAAVLEISNQAAAVLGTKQVRYTIIELKSLGDGRVQVTAKVVPVAATSADAKPNGALLFMAYAGSMR